MLRRWPDGELQSNHMTVVEVNRPNRQLRRRRGKNDTVDAEAAARAVLNGEATAQPKSRDGIVESIRILRTLFITTRNTRTRVSNQFLALAVTAADPIRARLAGKTTNQQSASRRQMRLPEPI